MSYFTLDTDPTSLYYDQTTQLDGREYLMVFQWATREACWYLGLYDQNETPIALGIRLVVSWPLLRRFATDPRLPPGVLFCADLTGQNADIVEPTDLGSRVLLTYITSDDPDLVVTS